MERMRAGFSTTSIRTSAVPAPMMPMASAAAWERSMMRSLAKGPRSLMITSVVLLFSMTGLGKTLILIGIVLVVVGAIFSLAGKLPWLGHLPGDITIQRERFTFYFPLATCILVSIIISLVLYFFRR